MFRLNEPPDTVTPLTTPEIVRPVLSVASMCRPERPLAQDWMSVLLSWPHWSARIVPALEVGALKETGAAVALVRAGVKAGCGAEAALLLGWANALTTSLTRP